MLLMKSECRAECFNLHGSLFFVPNFRIRVKRETKLVLISKTMKFVVVVLVSYIVRVVCWLVGTSSSVVPDWWKVMSSSLSSSAKASYRLVVSDLGLLLSSGRRLVSACRPVGWRLFGIIGVWLLFWWFSHLYWSSVVVVVCGVTRRAPVMSEGEASSV